MLWSMGSDATERLKCAELVESSSLGRTVGGLGVCLFSVHRCRVSHVSLQHSRLSYVFICFLTAFWLPLQNCVRFCDPTV